MEYTKYYEARNMIKDILEKDLIGPLSEDEIITEYPIVYYVSGKLYPQQCQLNQEHVSSEDIGETDEEQSILLDKGGNPSAMGISFSILKKTKKIYLSVKAAIYESVEKKEDEKIKWKRRKLNLDENELYVDELLEKKKIEILVSEGLSLIVVLHKIYKDGSMTITVSLVNNYRGDKNAHRAWVNKHTFFQPEITVYGDKKCFTDIRRNVKLKSNKESLEMEMLYSNYYNFATGHACAVDYKVLDEMIYLKTSFIPFYELNQMMPALNESSNILSMEYLYKTDKNILIDELKKWNALYKNWIENFGKKGKSLKEDYVEMYRENIDKCFYTYDTIESSIDCLADEDVYRAFVYTNEAMCLQREKVLQIKGIDFEKSQIKWYPFQLAFLLKEIVSFVHPEGEERKKVDLLWFPTGGGKTEAYLGIAAFVIFLRRLRNPSCGSGVTVMMRYTLRLLTFQQFERASAMICACEVLRRKYNIPGSEISIGLWAGRALTPNTLEMADKILKGYSDPDSESSNPRQLEKCPWCGEPLGDDEYTCSKVENRMIIKCKDIKCDFHKRLPIYVIDEDIYTYKPSFLIATVDKFAQVAMKPQTFSLFGKNSSNIPPELIIQDELHLISGPLGTITGIYEAAFQKLCINNKINAKIVASTATIKNAKEQILSLYASDFTQFPPQGVTIDDSYFAIKSSSKEKPSRMYLGIMGSGMSATSVMVRAMGAMLFATRYLESLGYDDEIIDSFWTLTNYFNTLRELGGAIIRVLDNVQDRFAYLKESKFKELYPIEKGQLRYDNYIELTSREKSENIGRIIQNDLKKKYSKDKIEMPYDFILSSNMISVGVDIARLNSMLMIGQPKTTAEYIQATSRVGRETPGLVFVLYNQMRSRDRSYFEQFYRYHEAFYKYVEATSVTPFAERARDRALQTLYIILCRFFIKELESNESACNYRRDIKGLDKIRDYIINYVKRVDFDELENVMEDLDEIEIEWEEKALNNDDLVYVNINRTKNIPALFEEDYKENSRFRVMNSMRSVETSVQVIVRE